MESQAEAYRVLIVDDDPGVRRALIRVLTFPELDEGPAPKSDAGTTHSLPEFNLSDVGSGQQAIKTVADSLNRQESFALAFLDMMMPEMNGAETAAGIWQLDPRIKIVFITAFSDQTPAIVTATTGRSDHFYVRKPFNAEVIRQFAVSLSRQWALEREREQLTLNLEKSNRELEDLNRDLEKQVNTQAALLFQTEKMASVGILAAGVAHEINNPAAFVISNLETLSRYTIQLQKNLLDYRAMAQLMGDGKTAEALERLKEIRDFEEKKDLDFVIDDLKELTIESLEGVTRIRDIVHDLRDVARDRPEELEEIDLNHLIDSMLNLIRQEYRERIEIKRNYQKLPAVYGAAQKLGQALMQILLNAFKAIDERGTVTITTAFEDLPGHQNRPGVKISIEDDGCGISEENQKKVFEPFFTTREVGQGSGLGLSISHNLIRAHHGNIRLESQPGLGTTVTIRLPLNCGPGRQES